MDEFRYVSYAQEIIFGAGSLANAGQAMERFGWQRLMLCTTSALRDNGQAGRLKATLAGRLVASYDTVQPHVPDFQVDEALALAFVHGVDAVVGMGGGSPIGMAKAVAFSLTEKREGRSTRLQVPTEQAHVPVVAVPTTYAGSEMTPVYGITRTRETPPRKVTVNDPRITPRLVIYDPALTFDLPAEMTASTGINALAHCIEALYSITRNPLSSAAALSGIQHISHALLCAYQQGGDLEARSEMLLGSHLAGLSLASVSMGLHHGICHVLGGTANVPHGIANAIMLPHVIRFNAETTAALLLPAAEALGVSLTGLSPVAAVEAAAQKISDLIAQMNLPQRLRDAGVKEADLPGLAQLGFENRTVQNNPRKPQDAAQIEDLLRAAW
jgi:alcohol dehydrogenase class IV